MEREVTIRSESVVSTPSTTEPLDGGAGTCLSDMSVRPPVRCGSLSVDSRVARARRHIHSLRRATPRGRIATRSVAAQRPDLEGGVIAPHVGVHLLLVFHLSRE